MSPGQAALKRWVDERTYRRAAAALGVGVMTVNDWVKGKTRPEDAARAKLNEVIGIPIDAWDFEADALPVKPPALAPMPADTSAKSRAYWHMCDIYTRQVAARESEASSRDLGLLDASLSRAVSVYGKLSGELELTEAQITRSPAWARLLEAIARGLDAFPQAAESLCRELEKLDGVSVVIPEGAEE